MLSRVAAFGWGTIQTWKKLWSQTLTCVTDADGQPEGRRIRAAWTVCNSLLPEMFPTRHGGHVHNSCVVALSHICKQDRPFFCVPAAEKVQADLLRPLQEEIIHLGPRERLPRRRRRRKNPTWSVLFYQSGYQLQGVGAWGRGSMKD